MANMTDENSDRLEVVQENKQQGKVDAINWISPESSITENMECSVAFQIVISVLYQLNEKYGDAMLSQERILQLQNHHDNNEAVISFYGTSNGGKSSILNSILGVKYLPINVQNETAVSVKIRFKLKDEKESNPTKKCQLIVNGEEEKLSPPEVCSRLTSINEKLRDTKMSKESSSYECTLSINHPVKCVTKENDVVVFLDTPGLDEFGSEKISQCVSMAENISSAFIFVTTFMDYKRDKLSYMLQELYKKDKDILKDDRLTIVINKMDEALKKRGDERCYTKDSVISDVQKYFCTVVFHCDPKEWPKKSIIVLCSSWSLYTRTSFYTRTTSQEDSMHVIDLCRTTLLTDNCYKKSLTEEPNVVKQNEVLELHSNILELESRLQEMSTRSLLLWKKKLMLDLSILLTETKENLMALLCLKEKECEDLEATMVLYTTAFQNYHSFSKKIVVNYKQAKKKSLPKDIEIAKTFRDAFNEDMKKTNLEKLMWEDIWHALSNFSNSILVKIDSRQCSPMKFITELRTTAKNIFKSLETRMNSSKCLSQAFLMESTRINMEIEVLVSDFSNISFNENQFATEPVIGNPNVPIPALQTEVRIPLKLKWTQELSKFLWGAKNIPREPDVVLRNESGMAVMNQGFEDPSEEFLADILDIIPELEDHQEAETGPAGTLEENLINFAVPHEVECSANTETVPAADNTAVSADTATRGEGSIGAATSLPEEVVISTSINDLSLDIIEGNVQAATRIAEDVTSTFISVDCIKILVQTDQNEDDIQQENGSASDTNTSRIKASATLEQNGSTSDINTSINKKSATQEQNGSASDINTSINEKSATQEQNGSASDTNTSRNEASATLEQNGSTSDTNTSINEATATLEQTGSTGDTTTCSSEGSALEESMSSTDKNMTLPYTNWSPKMDYVLNKMLEDFRTQITNYLGDPNNVIMQYCGQYYETAARILTEFNRKNGDIINEYGQKFSEIKKKKTDLEMERKVISSYIKQIEDFIKVLEAIDSKAPYSKQSL